MLNKETVTQLPLIVLSLPYKQTEDEKGKGEFEGMTNGEVAMVRLAAAAASGDFRALDMLQDRVVGKPMISSENKNINLTYEDFLNAIAEKEDEKEGD